MPSSPPRGIPRREFVKSAVAIGGASALSACLQEETAASTSTKQEFPNGPSDPSVLPDQQFAWNEYLVTDPNGDTILPRHQVLLFLEYTGSVPPTEEERNQVEDALRSIERAFERGTGGDASATFNDGLLFTLSYSPTYFDRFEESLPSSVDLPSPETVLEELDEPADAADDYDALLVLTSDYGSIPMLAEEGLFGDTTTINGVEITATLESIFEVQERRTGVVGRGLPAEELEHEGIHEDAPLSMGFKSGYQDTNPAEEGVTIEDGPFSGGATQLVSRLGIDLDAWYELDEEARLTQMFSTEHDRDMVGETGEGLGGVSRVSEEMAEDVEDDAAEHGRVGHAQKTARARDDEFVPRILRRSEGVSTDPDADAALNFTSLQQGMSDFIDVRKAMNDLGGDIEAHHSGIVDFLETKRRATFLVPPRSRRALPTPRPD